jgi:hypothetical protein
MDSSERIEAKLDEAILDALEQIRKLPAGSPERLKATVAASNLYKARDQRYKAEAEYNAAVDAKEKELEVKTAELELAKAEGRKNRTVQVLTTAGTLAFWGYQFGRTLKFEETGSLTNSVSKTLLKIVKF